MGYSGAEIVRFLGVTTSAVNRLAVLEKLKGRNVVGCLFPWCFPGACYFRLFPSVHSTMPFAFSIVVQAS